MKHLTRFFLATFIAALMLGGRAEAQTTSTWANSNVAGTPASPLDWFTGGPNTQGTWTGGTPASNSATTIQFFENTTTALTNTATPSSQTVNLNNGGSAFQLGTLTLSGLASATANANLTMTLSGDALNFSGATGTINLNALNATRTITYNVNNNIQLGTASIASALTIGGAGTGTFVLDGIISELKAGGGSLTKSGGSTVSLAGANTYTGATTVTGGVLLLNNANALPGGIGATGGTSALTLNGGVVGLTSNFSRGIGTSASQVQWASNGGGFAAYGADRTVNLGGNATPSTITWGNTAANGGFNGRTLILGAADATHTVELVNGLDLGSGARQIMVNNGAATFDAKLSGAIVGTGGLQLGNYQAGGSILLTGSNSYSGGTTIANVNGVVAISNANALGTGTVSMRQQMTLASTSPTPLTLNNRISYDNRDMRFTAKLGSADATGNLTLAGGLNFEKGGSWISGNSTAAFVELVGLSSVDITGQISGTYVSASNAEVGFQVKAGQTLRLGADNSAWTQNVVLAYPGTTVIGHAKALGSGTFLRFGTFDLGVGSAAGNSVVVSEVDLTGANALTQTVTIERVGSGSDYTAGGFAGTRSIELAGGVGFFTSGKSFANNISGGSLLISGDVRGTGVGATAEAYFVGTGNTTITGNIRNGDAATLNFRSENTGITTLSGSNTYNGTTTVNAGVLLLSTTAAVSGTAARPYSVAAAATLATGYALNQALLDRVATNASGVIALGTNSANNLNVTLLNSVSLGAVGSGTQAYSGTLTQTTTYRLGGGGGTLDFQSALTGANALIVGGGTAGRGGTVIVSGTANSFTGQTTVPIGTLAVSSLANVGAGNVSSLGAPTTTGNGTINLGSGTFAATLRYVGTTSSTSNRVINLLGTTGGATLDAAGSGALVLTSALTATGVGAKTLTLTGTSTADNTLTGAIPDAGSSTVVSVTKTGVGLWRLAGANSFTGSLNVTEGTLQVATINNASANGPLGNRAGAVLLGSSGKTGTLEYTGATASSTKPFTAVAGGTAAFSVTDAAAVLTLSGAIDGDGAKSFGGAGSAIISGAISGAGGLTKAGAGRLELTNINTFSGNTTLSSGTLKLGSGGSFANSPLIVVGDAGSTGAVLDLTEKSSFAIGAGQTLKGKGTVLLGENTAVTINGLLSPGNSPGLLTWSGSGSVALSGTTLMEVWGTSRGANPGYDAIDLINGTDLTFGGILQLDFNQLFADGTTFNLFTPDGTSSLASTFSSITMVGSSYTDLTFTNNAGLWTTNTGAANQSMTFNSATGTLSIIVVPEPAGIALAGLGLAAAAFAYRRRREARSAS